MLERACSPCRMWIYWCLFEYMLPAWNCNDSICGKIYLLMAAVFVSRKAQPASMWQGLGCKSLFNNSCWMQETLVYIFSWAAFCLLHESWLSKGCSSPDLNSCSKLRVCSSNSKGQVIMTSSNTYPMEGKVTFLWRLYLPTNGFTTYPKWGYIFCSLRGISMLASPSN